MTPNCNDVSVSDTGEQGMAPQDPAARAGIGGGVVPDDLTDGYAQAEELLEHPSEERADKPQADD